jgi:hypothetical protein
VVCGQFSELHTLRQSAPPTCMAAATRETRADWGFLLQDSRITRLVMAFLGARGALSLACVNKATARAANGGVGLWKELLCAEFLESRSLGGKHTAAASRPAAASRLRRVLLAGSPLPDHGFYRFVRESSLHLPDAERERRQLHWIGQGGDSARDALLARSHALLLRRVPRTARLPLAVRRNIADRLLLVQLLREVRSLVHARVSYDDPSARLCTLQWYAIAVSLGASVIPWLLALVGWLLLVLSWGQDCAILTFEVIQSRAGITPPFPLEALHATPNLTELPGVNVPLEECGLNRTLLALSEMAGNSPFSDDTLWKALLIAQVVVALVGWMISATPFVCRIPRCRGAAEIARVHFCAPLLCFAPQKTCASFDLFLRLGTALLAFHFVLQLVLLGKDTLATGWPCVSLFALGGVCLGVLASMVRLERPGWRKSFAGWCASIPGHRALTGPNPQARLWALVAMGYLSSQCLITAVYLLSYWGCSWLGVPPAPSSGVPHHPRQTWFPVGVTFVPMFAVALVMLFGTISYVVHLRRPRLERLRALVLGLAISVSIIAPGLKIQMTQEEGLRDMIGLIFSGTFNMLLTVLAVVVWPVLACARESLRAGSTPGLVDNPVSNERLLRLILVLIPGDSGPSVTFGHCRIPPDGSLTGTLTPAVASRVYIRLALKGTRLRAASSAAAIRRDWRREEPVTVGEGIGQALMDALWSNH